MEAQSFDVSISEFQLLVSGTVFISLFSRKPDFMQMIKMDSTTMIYRALVSTGAAEPVNLGQWVLATDNF